MVAPEFGGRHFLAALGELFSDPKVERFVEGFAVVEVDVVAGRRDGGEVAGVALGVCVDVRLQPSPVCLDEELQRQRDRDGDRQRNDDRIWNGERDERRRQAGHARRPFLSGQIHRRVSAAAGAAVSLTVRRREVRREQLLLRRSARVLVARDARIEMMPSPGVSRRRLRFERLIRRFPHLRRQRLVRRCLRTRR